jgi:hypothetical protein
LRLWAVAILAAAAPTSALAGAWAMEPGRTQVIVKYEGMRADEGFDIDGTRRPLLAERSDDTLALFAEHGLTDSLTLQLKAEWQSGEDFFVDYEGRGPVEIGVRWQALRTERSAVSLYAGYAWAGEGRNAGYAAPGAGDGDWEVRLLAGHSGRFGWLGGRDAFIEAQAARVFRDGLPDEDRAELTLGMHFGEDWMVLNQTYAGRTAEGPEAMWINSESSIVRRFGDWSLQAGWRQAVAGRGEVPAQSGPIVAVWRRF